MTPEQLDAIEARANAATPGPWTLDHPDDGTEITGPDSTVTELDIQFIIHARTDIPALIAEIRRLRRELGRLSSLADDAFDALGWDNYGNPDD